MVGPVEGFGGEASDLPLHFAGGGSAVCVWGRGKGALSDVHAHAGELFRMPGFIVLRHVQSLPYLA